MVRRMAVLLAIAIAALVVDAGTCAAAPPLSPRNPYRSFSITGLNYGSLQWERTHRGSYNGYHRSGGRLFRRR